MGCHKSRYESDREGSKRKKRRRSSSSSSEKERREERFKRLESTVESLDRRSYTRGSCIHKGDELTIPLFDPSKEDLTIEKWTEHVEDLAAMHDWDDRAIMSLASTRAAEGPRTTVVRRATANSNYMERN